MASPQIGFGGLQDRHGSGRQIRITVDATLVTGHALDPTFIHSVPSNRTIAECLPDILMFAGIRPPWTTAANNRSTIKVQVDSDGDGVADNDIADLSKTWMEAGVQEGDTVALADWDD